MPYKGKDDPNLPSNVKELNDTDREKWVATFNNVFSECTKDNGNPDECETTAMKIANGTVKKRFQKFMSWIVSIFRGIKDVETWDGSASNYDSTEAYCSACLIDVNSGDTKAQSHCMLPVRGPGDGKNTYVRQAVHAAVGGHGITQVKKPSDVSQDDWNVALASAARELKKAYGEMDEELPESVAKLIRSKEERAISFQGIADAAIEMIEEKQDEYAWLNDIYADTEGVFLVVSAKGKLFRVPVNINEESNVTFGEWQPVSMEFAPSTMPIEEPEEPEVEVEEPIMPMEQTSRMLILRTGPDEKPVYRWIGVSSVAVLNRAGELDSTSLFDSFIEHVENTGNYPIRQFYHSGGSFQTGQCDFLARSGYALITSGVYDDTELAKTEIEARMKNPDYWGDSIGFYATEYTMAGDEIKVPLYTKGILAEISTLPEAEAASWFTNKTNLKEVTRMNKRQYKALIDLFGGDEEKAKAWLNANVDETNRTIVDEGMLARSVEEDKPVENQAGDSDTTPAPEDEVQQIEVDEEVIKQITDSVAEMMQERLSQMVDAIGALSTRIDSIEAEMGKKNQSIELSINEIVSKLNSIETEEEERERAIVEDMPRPPVRVTYRPRNGGQLPAAEIEAEETAAEKAAKTLEKLNYKY